MDEMDDEWSIHFWYVIQVDFLPLSCEANFFCFWLPTGRVLGLFVEELWGLIFFQET